MYQRGKVNILSKNMKVNMKALLFKMDMETFVIEKTRLEFEIEMLL